MNTEVLDKLFLEWVATKPEFSPRAYYIDSIDTLVVMVEDCSTTEERVAWSSISLHRRNDEMVGKRNFVGFEVGGIRKFCQQNGIPFGKKMDLIQVLRKMADLNKAAVPAILDIAIPLVEDNNVELVF